MVPFPFQALLPRTRGSPATAPVVEGSVLLLGPLPASPSSFLSLAPSPRALPVSILSLSVLICEMGIAAKVRIFLMELSC